MSHSAFWFLSEFGGRYKLLLRLMSENLIEQPYNNNRKNSALLRRQMMKSKNNIPQILTDQADQAVRSANEDLHLRGRRSEVVRQSAASYGLGNETDRSRATQLSRSSLKIVPKNHMIDVSEEVELRRIKYGVNSEGQSGKNVFVSMCQFLMHLLYLLVSTQMR